MDKKALVKVALLVGLFSFLGCKTAKEGNSSSQAGKGWPEEGRVLAQAVAPKEFPRIPAPDASAAEVPDGYRAEVVLKDLTYPTSVTFDNEGKPLCG